MLLVPARFLADVKSFDPFPPVTGAPFAYPGSYEQGKEINNQDPGNGWYPDPHPYAAAEVWPPITEVDVSMYPWLSPVTTPSRVSSIYRSICLSFICACPCGLPRGCESTTPLDGTVHSPAPARL